MLTPTKKYMTIDQILNTIDNKPSLTNKNTDLAIKIFKNSSICESLEPIVISNNMIQSGNDLLSAIMMLKENLDPYNPAWHNIKLKVFITNDENAPQ